MNIIELYLYLLYPSQLPELYSLHILYKLYIHSVAPCKYSRHIFGVMH